MHRLRGSFTFYMGSGWDFSVHSQGEVYDDEAGINVGFYLQKAF